ncbi:T9SS type A sorting domain-containing protein [uncultured Aquimarina sp.]|uniref:T9SS type A sorting domain-containing protein n=1 Tax=uncultured Aquimarina sp. TaxID=575652 RepID=UPI0026059D56|nr:T9SS type A sorting domain-containing protein [uncultured Aquimarina sp.]
MRKQLFFLVGLLMSFTVSVAQQVYVGDLTLSSQAEIDAFNYSEIRGSLTIQESQSGDITDLTPLETLEILGGGLFIIKNDNLQNLYGLSGIKTVNGNLEIMNNTDLNDISSLSNLERVLSDVKVHANHKITSLNPFNGLIKLGGGLSIHWNLGLSTLDGFNNVERIEGHLEVTSNLNMTDISGLRNLIFIEGHLRIVNTKISDLEPLRKVTSILSLILKKTPIYNLDGLSGINEIRGGLYIHNNPYLQNIKGISDGLIGNFVTLDFENNPNLESIEGTEKITSINIDIRFVGNTKLRNLDALSNIMFVIDDVEIKDNTNLESACGIVQLLEDPSLVYRGTITIQNNGADTSDIERIIDICNNCRIYFGDILLSDQSDIDNFRYCKVNGDVIIEEALSGEIININGLSNLTTVIGDLVIKNNERLEDLNALSNLSVLRRDFIIENNTALTDLGDFDLLKATGGSLNIVNNPSIQTLNGFSELRVLSGDLYIHNNQNLTNLDGLRLRGFDMYRFCDIKIGQNNSLTNIDAISDVGLVPGSVIVYDNPVLQTLDGLSGIYGVQDQLSIIGNTALQNACGIVSLLEPATIWRSILQPSLGEISNNGSTSSSVQEIINFCKRTHFGDLILRSQEEIDAFDYEIIRGALIIEESVPGNITNLDPLYSLLQVDSVIIRNNTSLTSLGRLAYSLIDVVEDNDSFILDNNPLLFKSEDSNSRSRNYFEVYYMLCLRTIREAKVRYNATEDYEVIRGYPPGSIGCTPGPVTVFKPREPRPRKKTAQQYYVGNEPLKTPQKLIMYPTVTDGIDVTINGLSTDFTYTIYSMTGVLMKQGSLQNEAQLKTIRLDSHLDTGMYLMKIQENDKVTTLRFMVK